MQICSGRRRGLFLLLISPVLHGQTRFRAPSLDYTPKLQSVRAATRTAVDATRASRVSLGAVSQEEIDSVRLRPQAEFVGVERRVPSVDAADGTWQNGVWTIRLHSPGAKAMRVRFDGVSPGDGQLFVSGHGPYPNGGSFWSNTVAGDEALIEWHGAPGTLPFRIEAVAHALYDFEDASSKPDRAAACHVEAQCSEFGSHASGVGRYVFEDRGAWYQCSGALINDAANSRRALFLTASHCIDNEDAARSIEVFWNYETPVCGAEAPALATLPRTLGSKLLATGALAEGDIALIELDSLPPVPLKFYGWSAEPDALAIGGQGTGLHHPRGSHKRVSWSQRQMDQTVRIGAEIAPAGKFYFMQNVRGLTESGSSGSPLFRDPDTLIGVLSYGSAVTDPCAAASKISGYGKFHEAFAYLRDALAAATR